MDVKITKVETDDGRKADFDGDGLYEIGYGQVFTVTGTLTNDGYEDLKHGDLTLSYDEDCVEPWDQASATLRNPIKSTGKITQGHTFTATWPLKCTSVDEEDGCRDMTFTLDGGGESECHDLPSDSASISVEQKELVVEVWTDDTCGKTGQTFNVGQDFDVYYRMYAYPQYDKPEIAINGVEIGTSPALTETDAPITLRNPSSSPLDLTGSPWSIDAYDSSDPTATHSITRTWRVRGANAGEGLIRINAWGYRSPGVPSGPVDNDNKTKVVIQEPAELEGSFVSPADGAWVPEGEFDVKVKLENPGGAYATGAWLELKVLSGDAEFTSGGTTKTWTGLSIAGGEYVEKKADLECTGPCNAIIEMTWEGQDCNTGATIAGPISPPQLHVNQMPVKATIDATHDVITESNIFDVDALIQNTDTITCTTCKVEGIKAVLKVMPEGGAVLEDGEQYTKTIGTLRNSERQKAEWKLHCKKPGIVVVRVDVLVTTEPGTQDEPLDPPTVIKSNYIAVVQRWDGRRYRIQLCKEWNLFSLPLRPTNVSVGTVLSSLDDNYNEIWGEYSPKDGTWKLYDPDLTAADYAAMSKIDKLTEVKDGNGYFIEMVYSDLLEGKGFRVQDQQLGTSGMVPWEYDLMQGWNLIGFTPAVTDTLPIVSSGAVSETAGTYLLNLDDDSDGDLIGKEARFVRTYYRHAFNQKTLVEPCKQVKWAQFANDDSLFWAGQGYWLYASLDDLSIIPSVVDPQ